MKTLVHDVSHWQGDLSRYWLHKLLKLKSLAFLLEAIIILGKDLST